MAAMELTLQAFGSSEGAGVVQASDNIFAAEYKPALIHQIVTAYLAGGRAGTSAQKNRSAVRGGGIKPWRQKGTGRARAGTSRSPLWRSGGVTFASSTRDYSQKVNKKMYRGALCSMYAELNRQDRLQIIENAEIDAPKTKDLIAKLSNISAGDQKVLIITDKINVNLELSARNLHWVAVSEVGGIDPVSLVWADKVLLTSAALKQLEEKLG
jgi:large subunit ribosomal protein L4